MRLFKDGGESGSDRATVVLAVSSIEEANATVVGATDNEITVLLRESEGAKRGVRLETHFRAIWVVQVPDV